MTKKSLQLLPCYCIFLVINWFIQTRFWYSFFSFLNNINCSRLNHNAYFSQYWITLLIYSFLQSCFTSPKKVKNLKKETKKNLKKKKGNPQALGKSKPWPNLFTFTLCTLLRNFIYFLSRKYYPYHKFQNDKKWSFYLRCQQKKIIV